MFNSIDIAEDLILPKSKDETPEPVISHPRPNQNPSKEITDEVEIMREIYQDFKNKQNRKPAWNALKVFKDNHKGKRKRKKKKQKKNSRTTYEPEPWNGEIIEFVDLPDEIKIEILGFLNSHSEIPKYFCLSKEINEFMKLKSTLRGIVLSKIDFYHRNKLNEYITEVELRELLFRKVVLEVDNLEIRLTEESKKEKEERKKNGKEEEERTVYYEFTATDDEELDVEEGELVTVLEDVGDWLFVRNSSGREGYVPTTYVEESFESRQKYVYEFVVFLFPMNKVDKIKFHWTGGRTGGHFVEHRVMNQILKDMKKQLEEEYSYEVQIRFKSEYEGRESERPKLTVTGKLL